MNKRIDILPGGELSDVVPTELGASRHQLSKNIRQVRVGEWETVKGHISVFTPAGTPTIKAGVEVDDDLSGDRFIIYQDGTAIKRVNYDPTTAYASASPSTLSLPSGITIGANTTLKFFVYMGTVRIVGATDGTKLVPLWYGYVDRTLFPDSWREVYLGCFETDTESWSGNNATLSQYDCDADGDTSGMWGAPEKVNALKVLQTGASGSARKSFTVASGVKVRVLLMAFRKSTGTGAITVKIGKTAGGAEYETLTTTTEDAWVMLESTEFTTSSTTLHIELIPGTGSAEIGYFDFIYVEENAQIVISGWKLCKAELTPYTINIENNASAPAGATIRRAFGKVFFTYDESQYSIPAMMNVLGTPSTTGELLNNFNFDKMYLDLRLTGANLETSYLNNRLSGFGFSMGELEAVEAIDPDSVPLYVGEEFDFTTENKQINFISTLWYRNDVAVYPNNLYGHMAGIVESEINPNEWHLKVGSRVIITTEDGTLDTVVTEVSGFNISVAHNITPLGGDASPDGAGYVKFDHTEFQIDRKWDYSASLGYGIRVAFDITALAAEMYDYLDIPAGTSDNTPDYDQHAVAGDMACVVSNEDDETDIARYSPTGQLDSFPDQNLVSLLAGDGDSVKWIGVMNNRFVALKRKSLSKFAWSGSAFSLDVKIASNGLYTGFKGALIADEVLYFMDQDDLYMFDGNQVVSLMKTKKMRKRYREGIGTDSFLVWDKLNSELQVHLTTGNIIVWHPEMDEWYERTKPGTLLGGFLDADNKLVVFDSSKFITQNHPGTTFLEALQWEIKSMLFDGSNPERYKQIEKIMAQLKTAQNFIMSIQDPNDARTYSKTVTSPPASVIGMIEDYPDYLFEEAEITVKGAAASTTFYALLRRIILEVAAWQ